MFGYALENASVRTDSRLFAHIRILQKKIALYVVRRWLKFYLVDLQVELKHISSMASYQHQIITWLLGVQLFQMGLTQVTFSNNQILSKAWLCIGNSLQEVVVYANDVSIIRMVLPVDNENTNVLHEIE